VKTELFDVVLILLEFVPLDLNFFKYKNFSININVHKCPGKSHYVLKIGKLEKQYKLFATGKVGLKEYFKFPKLVVS